ncbi:MAG: type II toxin-antitoxin system HicA family toxin [Chloroflexi bacterium]|nr:type II toxin-antitoxin system HicA family toxin [Chloroflexota bacterium]
MPRRYSTEEVIKVLESFGFRLVRDARHAIMDGPGHVVPVPKDRKQMPSGTMSSILRKAGITRRDFEERAGNVL